MKIYLGASGAINPLGNSVSGIYQRLLNGETGIAKYENVFDFGKDEYLGIIDEALLPQGDTPKIFRMLDAVIQQTEDQLQDKNVLHLENTRLIVCTTKGNISELENQNAEGADLNFLSQYLQQKLNIPTQPLIVSSACISGLLGIINGARMIRQGLAEHVVVVGVDLVTKFTLSGFISFYATASGVSKPYDKERDGINLGEAAASLVLSKDSSIYKKVEAEYLGGASANDANHISGPSRNGEGLYRSIIRALKDAETSSDSIDYISAHGTGTSFNDEMESIAFDRANLTSKPLNSFKGYFGHTLGAAGLIESLLGLEALKQNTLAKSFGYANHGVSGGINVLAENLSGDFSILLKTASGFGGSNAAGIFRKL